MTVSHTPSETFEALLQNLQVTHASYCRVQVTKPWGIALSKQHGARMHVVVSGSCFLRVANRRPVQLLAGDVALLPHGDRHAIADPLTAPTHTLMQLGPKPLGDGTFHLEAGGGGAQALVVCCTVAFAAAAAVSLMKLMPRVLILRRADARDAQIIALLQMMADEVLEARFGAVTIVARLADVLIAKLVRAWAERDETSLTGGLAVLRDPQIGRALAAMHRQPSEAWSLATLSKLAGMSRSAFAERFLRLLGTPPRKYLSTWRLHLAELQLRTEELSIAEIAGRTGYRSEAAFSRAFKRRYGVAPSALRGQAARR